VEPSQVVAGPELDLGIGLGIRSAHIAWKDEDSLLLSVCWQAQPGTNLDYSIAAHLVAADPPQTPDDILAQDDQANPVYSWYPTSRWTEGEVVCTHHLLIDPQGTSAQAVRVALYRVDDSGNFVNSPWLSLPVPEH